MASDSLAKAWLENVDVVELRNAPMGARGPRIRRLAYQDNDAVAKGVACDHATSTHYASVDNARPLCGATTLSRGGRVTGVVCSECRAVASQLDAEVVR